MAPKPKFAAPLQTAPAIVQDEGEALRRALLARLEFEELNLQLVGVATYQGQNSCFIKHPGSPEQMVYTAGDVIGGYRIAKIDNQSVSFEREGNQFFLMLGESSGNDRDEGPMSDDPYMPPATALAAKPATPAASKPLITPAEAHTPQLAEAPIDLGPALANEVAIKQASDGLKVKTRRFESAKLIEDGFKVVARSASRAKFTPDNSGGAFVCAMPLRNGEFTSPYGYRRHPLGGGWRLHKGTDIAGPYGTPVRSAARGVVLKVRSDLRYGKMIVIKHDNGYETLYGHLSRQLVSVGQVVAPGDEIGREGNTGWSTGPHLHFEVHKNGMVVNPEPYLRRRR